MSVLSQPLLHSCVLGDLTNVSMETDKSHILLTSLCIIKKTTLMNYKTKKKFKPMSIYQPTVRPHLGGQNVCFLQKPAEFHSVRAPIMDTFDWDRQLFPLLGTVLGGGWVGSWVWCMFRGLLCPVGPWWVSLGDCGLSCGLSAQGQEGLGLGLGAWLRAGPRAPPGFCTGLPAGNCPTHGGARPCLGEALPPLFLLCLERKGRMDGPPVPTPLDRPGVRLATLQVGKLLDRPCVCRLWPMVGLVF